MAGSIGEQVLNQRDGQPISGASLKLTGEGIDENTSSDNNGKFEFGNLADGKYDLLAKKEGFDDGIYGPLALVDGHPLILRIALQPSSVT